MAQIEKKGMSKFLFTIDYKVCTRQQKNDKNNNDDKNREKQRRNIYMLEAILKHSAFWSSGFQ